MGLHESLLSLAHCYSRPVPMGYRRLAWEGVSFCVPSNWELADYRIQRRRAVRVEVEDEVAIRLEGEWIRATNRLSLESVMERYEKASKPLTNKAEEMTQIDGLPNGWHATRFTFKETGSGKTDSLQIIVHELVTVFFLCPQNALFGCFLLHFLPEDREDPIEITKNLAESFQDHRDQATCPWELFDIGYRLPKDFLLQKAFFDIGSKFMVYEWKKRRLLLWSYSCADIFLKDWSSPEHWAVGSLNAAKQFKGIVFRLDDGKISWRRNRMHPIGVRDEIGRWCFSYDMGCKLIEDKNQLLVWVYQHRSPSDLHRLASF